MLVAVVDFGLAVCAGEVVATFEGGTGPASGGGGLAGGGGRHEGSRPRKVEVRRWDEWRWWACRSVAGPSLKSSRSGGGLAGVGGRHEIENDLGSRPRKLDVRRWDK